MKILLSAFAYAPNSGSEAGVGWRWAAELARHHDVTVVTDTTRRDLVEAEGVLLPDRVEVVYWRPFWLRAVPLNSTTAQVLYTLWQFGLIGFAKRLHTQKRFDLAMHVTYSVFRHPSFLGLLGIPFIFGPLGGGEDAPWALKRSIKGREKLKELLRCAINCIAKIDPLLWFAYSKATVILVSTKETKHALPFPFRKRAIVYPNLGIDAPSATELRRRVSGEPLRALFVGRLLGWKGAHLAIRAFALAIEEGAKIEFTLVGRGPFGAELQRLAIQLGVDERINWIEGIPYKDMPAFMQKHHCFLFPSLHDSGGTVVIEAQASGLPVICLDLGGPCANVTPATAVVVPTRQRSEDEVVIALCGALTQLEQDESTRYAMAEAAVSHIRETMNWEKRVLGALQHVKVEQYGT